MNIIHEYTYSVIIGYRMYNMYCRDLAGPIYDIISNKHQGEKYSLYGAANGRRSCAQHEFPCSS